MRLALFYRLPLSNPTPPDIWIHRRQTPSIEENKHTRIRSLPGQDGQWNRFPSSLEPAEVWHSRQAIFWAVLLSILDQNTHTALKKTTLKILLSTQQTNRAGTVSSAAPRRRLMWRKLNAPIFSVYKHLQIEWVARKWQLIATSLELERLSHSTLTNSAV